MTFVPPVPPYGEMINTTVSFIYQNLIEAPNYHVYLEAALFIWVFWLLRKKKQSEKLRQLTVEEEELIISTWKPRPLVDIEKENLSTVYDVSDVWGNIEGRPGKYLEIEGEKYLNLATHNYLGLVDNKELDEAAEKCIRRYGVGSCGPRGFYGTVDVHIQLEEKIAQFLTLEETALYSYGFAAVSSAIPSYAKGGDVIFADELVSFQIQRGLQASRSTIVYFQHNSVEDFKQKLDEQVKKDRKNLKKAKATRRFCVVEGLYTKRGDICPLNEITDLCRKYKVRLFVDETISFGVLGKTGRGVTEHLGVDLKDIDFISGSLEHGLASFGGFIVGPSFIVDHQRISGLGYCFSASLPPLLAGAGIQALSMVENNPNMIEELRDICKYAHQKLENALSFFYMTCDPLSPVKYLYLVNSEQAPREELNNLLKAIIVYVKKNFKFALLQPNFYHTEHILPVPSIRIIINRLLTHDEVDMVAFAIEEASKELKTFNSLVNCINDEETTKTMSEYAHKIGWVL